MFGLSIEHSKTETFYFNRSHGTFNPPPLNLLPLGGPILYPKSSWKYLGFIFDWKLIFHQHIDFYSNKAISMVKYMKILGNSTWEIKPTQKQLLYRCYILVRHDSHWGGSLQNGLRDEQTCGMTLASAYVLCHLSATWSQLQIKERKSEWEWVLIGMSSLNTGDRVQWEFISVDYQTSELQCNY